MWNTFHCSNLARLKGSEGSSIKIQHLLNLNGVNMLDWISQSNQKKKGTRMQSETCNAKFLFQIWDCHHIIYLFHEWEDSSSQYVLNCNWYRCIRSLQRNEVGRWSCNKTKYERPVPLVQNHHTWRLEHHQGESWKTNKLHSTKRYNRLDQTGR